ncbi:MAG: hypothetical protein IT449_16360 [Phycisphaerales bacterium]|nr:hypothetical protein [Phycisphaerales bacterium]
MFSRLLFVRLRAAEASLKAGKLDEAYRLAGASDIRTQARGKAVLEQLADRFVERAREHFRADRFADALSDLDKADAAGVRREEIAELRKNIQTVAQAVHVHQASRQVALDEARRHVEAGSLAAGRQAIERTAEHDPEARRLGQVIEQRDAEAAVLVEQARQRLAQGQFAPAVERLEAARRIDAHDPQVVAVEAELIAAGVEQARRAIHEGRLARAAEELKSLRTLGQQDPGRRELEDFLRLARTACDQVKAHAFSEARKTVVALSAAMANVKWLDRVSKQLKEADDLELELKAGPLGQWATWQPMSPAPAVLTGARTAAFPAAGFRASGVASSSLDETVVLGSPGSLSDGMPSRLLMLVDGGGSFLVVRGERCGIGRAAADQPADVALFGDLAERHAEIARVDEDYFIFASKDIEIGGRAYRQQLLRDGDRVVLGKRAKFEFRTPSRKSLTAVLNLSDTTKMPGDVRTVVLLKDFATIGNGSTAHIRCRLAERPLVLLDRGGRLWVQPGGADASQGQWVELGRPMEMCGVSFVVEPWRGKIAAGC